MPARILTKFWRRPTAATTWTLFIVLVAATAWLRLVFYPDRVVSLTYALPLLICLFYPARKLLWAMVGAFLGISAYKTLVLLKPVLGEDRVLHAWSMQVLNIIVVAVTVHVILNLLLALEAATHRLEQANRDLVARDEEISRQNEELHAQAEELAQQNEEIQQQNEETQQQAEELQAQAEELSEANSELAKREAIMETLIDSLNGQDGDGAIPEKMCAPLLGLFPGIAAAVVIWEERNGRLGLVAQQGLQSALPDSIDKDSTLTGAVMEQNRPAFVEDLALRPDLLARPLQDAGMRSVLAAPLRIEGRPAGGIEVYARQPQGWTKQQFKLLEWATAHCGLLLEVRRLHQQLVQSNTDLDRLVRERTGELQEMVNELEHFSYSITHDLRAPLRAMHGFAGMLAEECADRLTEQSREYLRRLTTAATRMDRLITDALVYSKTVREELALRPLDPAELLRGMIESYPAFQEPHAKIRVDPGLPRVLANEAALTQCFSNLLGNAVKFVARGTVPEVRVRADRIDGVVRLWFEDNGIGIPAEMQSRVFLMFQRASKEFEGTGIGLALVRKVAERMGGRVGVVSEPGQGSRFWVELKAPSHS